ncbi:MAG TPA: alanine racemase [Terracidiphilus sp.]|nr:alanine racemase [Terracidiphilus sp.]
MPMRPCWVEINTQSLENNFRFLAGLAGLEAELLAVVKADAYGHSLSLCAPTVVRAGARWLGVTSVEEAVTARSLCPDARILAIGGVFPGQGQEVLRQNLIPVVWDPAHLDELDAAARSADAAAILVHLEIDSGMSRQGVDLTTNLDTLLARFQASPSLQIEGVMTHLYAADEADGQANDEQLRRTEKAVTRIQSAGFHPAWLNVGASATLVSGQSARIVQLAARLGMKALIRPGLSLYGIAPQFDPPFEPPEPPALLQSRTQLKPVLSWKSRVISTRSIGPGAVVGYNGTFVATEPMRLALVAAGYADGLDRRLGNRFRLLVRGQRAPLVGRISMDHAVLDVTEIPAVATGDEVVILGTQANQEITAYDHASACGTIPWEVFTRIASRVARIAV